MSDVTTTKTREDRLRRKLARTKHALRKTPSRSSLREHFGCGYMIIDERNVVVAGAHQREYELSLEEAEAFAADVAA